MTRLIVALVLVTTACGKKGPPLPPLVKIPSAPADFLAERRGATTDLQLTVPAANTDNTRPANIARIDLYAITLAAPIPEPEIVKQGTRVGSVAVKAPRDPDQTIDEDEPAADMEPPEGQGLDQGAIARVSEELTPEALVAATLKKDRRAPADEPAASGDGPLLGPRPLALRRFYVAVGVTAKDRKGAYSRPLAVPLVPPPPPPPKPEIKYDETAVSLKWAPVATGTPVQAPPSSGDLDSRPIGPPPLPIAYNVYDVSPNAVPAKLTASPVAEPSFSDSRMVWDEERCYTVRAVEKVGDLTIESDAPEPECETLTDTFPPAVPANLQSSPGEGVISLIWDANTEKDLAGYIVLRGPSLNALEPLMSSPLAETSFSDRVQTGVRYTYAVRAVDKAGNASDLSKPVEEAAR